MAMATLFPNFPGDNKHPERGRKKSQQNKNLVELHVATTLHDVDDVGDD